MRHTPSAPSCCPCWTWCLKGEPPQPSASPILGSHPRGPPAHTSTLILWKDKLRSKIPGLENIPSNTFMSARPCVCIVPASSCHGSQRLATHTFMNSIKRGTAAESLPCFGLHWWWKELEVFSLYLWLFFFFIGCIGLIDLALFFWLRLFLCSTLFSVYLAIDNRLGFKRKLHFVYKCRTRQDVNRKIKIAHILLSFRSLISQICLFAGHYVSCASFFDCQMCKVLRNNNCIMLTGMMRV